MKKLITTLVLVLMTTLSLFAKCDWSSLKLQQWNERNYYKWYVSGEVLDDSCVDYMFMVYDFQTKKIDTLTDYRGIVEVQFNVKGRYKLYLKAWDKCEKCDTALYREVNIIQFPGASVGYLVNNLDCKKYKFEMNYIEGYPLKDTCIEYYLMFYSGPWINKMSESEWDSLTDYRIGMEYDFPDDDFLGYNQTRVSDFTFKDSGRVLVIAQWWNKCVSQDTFIFKKLNVCKNEPTNKTKVPLPPTSGIKVYPNPADDKVIFTVASTNKIIFNTYEVYDSKGKLVLTGKMGSSISVGTYNLPNGVYVVKIGKLVQKFIVKH